MLVGETEGGSKKAGSAARRRQRKKLGQTQQILVTSHVHVVTQSQWGPSPFETLLDMFPSMDPDMVRQVLNSMDGSLERAIDCLLPHVQHDSQPHQHQQDAFSDQVHHLSELPLDCMLHVCEHLNMFHWARMSCVSRHLRTRVQEVNERKTVLFCEGTKFKHWSDTLLLRMLQTFPNLRQVSLGGASNFQSFAQLPSVLPAVTSLSLSSCAFLGDYEIMELAGFLPGLRSLDLAGTNITDEALEYVGRLSSLTNLNLHHTAITNHGVESLLTRLPTLLSLSLKSTAMTNEIGRWLSGLPPIPLTPSQNQNGGQGAAIIAPGPPPTVIDREYVHHDHDDDAPALRNLGNRRQSRGSSGMAQRGRSGRDSGKGGAGKSGRGGKSATSSNGNGSGNGNGRSNNNNNHTNNHSSSPAAAAPAYHKAPRRSSGLGGLKFQGERKIETKPLSLEQLVLNDCNRMQELVLGSAASLGSTSSSTSSSSSTSTTSSTSSPGLRAQPGPRLVRLRNLQATGMRMLSEVTLALPLLDTLALSSCKLLRRLTLRECFALRTLNLSGCAQLTHFSCFPATRIPEPGPRLPPGSPGDCSPLTSNPSPHTNSTHLTTTATATATATAVNAFPQATNLREINIFNCRSLTTASLNNLVESGWQTVQSINCSGILLLEDVTVRRLQACPQLRVVEYTNREFHPSAIKAVDRPQLPTQQPPPQPLPQPSFSNSDDDDDDDVT